MSQEVLEMIMWAFLVVFTLIELLSGGVITRGIVSDIDPIFTRFSGLPKAKDRMKKVTRDKE